MLCKGEVMKRIISILLSALLLLSHSSCVFAEETGPEEAECEWNVLIYRKMIP